MRRKAKSKIQLFVSQKVRELRDEQKLTQEQFAERINRSRAFFANRENPNCEMAFSLDMINIIAKEFKISPKFFIPDEGL